MNVSYTKKIKEAAGTASSKIYSSHESLENFLKEYADTQEQHNQHTTLLLILPRYSILEEMLFYL